MTYLDNLEQLDGLRDDVNAELTVAASPAQWVGVTVDGPRGADDAVPGTDLEQRRTTATATVPGLRRDEKAEAHDAEVGGGVARSQTRVVDDVTNERTTRNTLIQLVA